MNKSSQSESTGSHLLWTALGLGLLVALWLQWLLLTDAFKVNDDLRNLYWLHRMIDPTLFANDTLVGHQLMELEFLGQSFVISKFSPGYGILFFLSGLTNSVILFSKLLIFPLMLISVFYLFRLGQTFTTEKNALVLCIGFIFLNLIFSSNISVTAGLQRSFALPLLIALLYYLTRQHYWRAALVVFLSSTIYPPIFILGAATFGLSLVHVSWGSQGKRFSIQWKPLLPLGTAVFLSALLLLPALLAQGSDQVASSIDQTSSFFDLGPLTEGRYPLFTVFPYTGPGGLFVFGSDALNAVILVFLALGMKFLLKSQSRPLPPIVLVLLSASLICFVLAWLGIFLTKSFPLYFPSRYTQTTIVLASLFYLVLNGKAAMHHAAKIISEYSRKPVTLVASVTLLMAPVIVYGWFRFPDRQLFFNFSIAFALLWLVLVTLLLVRNLRKEPSPSSQVAAANATSISTRSWVVLGFCIFVGLAIYGRILDENADPPEADHVLFAYLQTLPKDSRLAGNPCSLDNIPLFAQRMILFSCETPHTNQLLMQEALESYYAADRQTVNQFCQKYEVDYLLIHQDTFADRYIQEGAFLFEPFDTQMQQILATRRDFALENIAQEDILFQDGSLILTACPLP
ncbi:MAG: hypothetical protein IPM53_09860 [Anaerolineaceae bacterium]|nr:hypothetical protein [Anaerolineaceae bacterium]